MTTEEKEILIQTIIDCPDTLTDTEIKRIINDVELKELYEVSVEMKNSLMKPKTLDMRKEWQDFVKRLLRTGKWSFKRIFRAAAIIIGAVFVSAASDDNEIDLLL